MSRLLGEKLARRAGALLVLGGALGMVAGRHGVGDARGAMARLYRGAEPSGWISVDGTMGVGSVRAEVVRGSPGAKLEALARDLRRDGIGVETLGAGPRGGFLVGRGRGERVRALVVSAGSQPVLIVHREEAPPESESTVGTGDLPLPGGVEPAFASAIGDGRVVVCGGVGVDFGRDTAAALREEGWRSEGFGVADEVVWNHGNRRLVVAVGGGRAVFTELAPE